MISKQGSPTGLVDSDPILPIVIPAPKLPPPVKKEAPRMTPQP